MSWISDVVSVAAPVAGGALGTLIPIPGVGTAIGATAGQLVAGAVKQVDKPPRGAKRVQRAAAPPPGAVPVAGPAPVSNRTPWDRVKAVEVRFHIGADGKVTPRAIIRDLPQTVASMVVPDGSSKGDALATAGRLVASLASADPKLASYAKAVMNATATAARNGSVPAQRAVSVIKTAQAAGKSKSKLTGFLVTPSGRVVIGSFVQVG